MDNDTLRKIQLIQLDIAKEVKRICEELNINYFLDSGTLLGAVRHGGFIPWDDDLDMGMLREDYERFANEAEKIIGDDYCIQTLFNDPDSDILSMKVRKKGTVYREAASPKGMKNNGIYIDVFAYDVYPDEEEKRNYQGKILDKYRMMILSKSGTKLWHHLEDPMDRLKVKIKCVGYKVLTAFKSKTKMFQEYDNYRKLYNKESSKNYCAHTTASIYGKWVVPRACFDSFIKLKFEDDEFMCPAGYDLYLTSVYGDYMTPPPEDKRVGKHDIKEIKM